MATLGERLRKASASLTVRGRCLLAAGATCTVIAFPLSEADLLRVGLFLLVLPVISVLVVTRTRFKLTSARRLSSVRIQVGSPAQVDLQVRNDSRLPTTVLKLEDVVPYALGARPRFVIDRLEPNGTRRVTYSVTPGLRGKYRIGPLALTLTDPFGCVEVEHEFASSNDLTVIPPIVALPSLRVPTAYAHAGEHNARVLAAVGEVDIGTRSYRHGDDLRKIHWRSTARTGELMVRQEQAGRTSKACVLLDTRASAHKGDRVTGSFEWSVSAAASVVSHLARGEHPVELVTGYSSLPASGVGIASALSLSNEAAHAMHMDRLAQVALSEHDKLRPELAAIRSRAVECGSLYAVVGAVTSDDLHALAPLGKLVPAAHIVLIDVASWEAPVLDKRSTGGATRQLNAARKSLLSAGWKVSVARRGESIADAWQRLGDRL